MASGSDHRARLRGLFVSEPELILAHSITVGLEVSCAMAATERGKRALFTIARDAKLSEHASVLIMRHMLRSMVENDEPNKSDFQRLVKEVVALADAQ